MDSIAKFFAKPLHLLYGAGFLFTAHYATLEFINSSYLNQFIPLDSVGLIYIIASFLSIILLTRLSQLVTRYGNFWITLLFLGISTATLLGMALTKNPFVAVLFFLLHYALIIVIRTNLDIYFEEINGKHTVGHSRGIYLTIINVAWVASPLFVAIFVRNNRYDYLYLVSTVLSLIVMFALYKLMGRKDRIVLTHTPFWHTIAPLWRNRDIRGVFLCRFLFNFFVAWLTIYAPIYLHTQIGFSWQAIGIMFTIMLLPYVLFEIPLGKIADRYLGEKEILAAGYLIMAVSAAAISFITEPIFLIWLFIFFLTRVGGSFVDIMTETYFFKKATPGDTNTLEFFRDSDPAAYIIAPLTASFLLLFVDMRYMFFALGIIVVAGILVTATMKDTL